MGERKGDRDSIARGSKEDVAMEYKENPGQYPDYQSAESLYTTLSKCAWDSQQRD